MQVISGNLRSQSRGSVFAFIIALVAIIGGMFLIYSGKDASGLATVITSLAGLAGVFVYSKLQQTKERVEKSTALAERRRR